MKYLLAVAATAAITLAPLPAGAAHTGCPPAGGWSIVEPGDVVDGSTLPDGVLVYDRNQDGLVCAKVNPAPDQEFKNPNALGAIDINIIDNRVGATSSRRS